jgi:hypothetical protein
VSPCRGPTVTRSGAAKASRGVEGDERIGIETSGNAGSPFSVSSLGWTTTSRTTHPRLGRNPSAADSRAPRCWRMRLSRGRPSPRFAEGSRRRTGAGLDLLGLEDMVVAEVALGGGGAREAGGAELAGVHERWGATRPRPCQGHTPIIDTRHDGEHLLRSRNAAFAPRHATHTHASLRSVSGAAAHTRNASGAQSPSLTVAFGTRSRDRSGRPWPRHAESRSARGGPGCRYSVSPPALRKASVRPETRDSVSPSRRARARSAKGAAVRSGMCGLRAGGEGRSSARAQVFRVMTCVDDRCRCLAGSRRGSGCACLTARR